MTTDVLEVGTAAWVVGTGGDWSGGRPEGLAAVQVLLMLLEHLREERGQRRGGVGRGGEREGEGGGE